MTGNKITKKKINKKCSAENKKNTAPSPSYGCPTNLFHHFFLTI
jgi:hypothetical protein